MQTTAFGFFCNQLVCLSGPNFKCWSMLGFHPLHHVALLIPTRLKKFNVPLSLQPLGVLRCIRNQVVLPSHLEPSLVSSILLSHVYCSSSTARVVSFQTFLGSSYFLEFFCECLPAWVDLCRRRTFRTARPN